MYEFKALQELRICWSCMQNGWTGTEQPNLKEAFKWTKAAAEQVFGPQV